MKFQKSRTQHAKLKMPMWVAHSACRMVQDVSVIPAYELLEDEMQQSQGMVMAKFREKSEAGICPNRIGGTLLYGEILTPCPSPSHFT